MEAILRSSHPGEALIPSKQVQGQSIGINHTLGSDTRGLMTDPSAMLPPNEELIEELSAPTYDTDSGKIEVMKKADMKEILKRSPNYLDCLAMTFAGQGGFFGDCNFEAY